MQSIVRTETYTYDAVDQVTGVDYGNARTEGFVYDAVGNSDIRREQGRQSATDSAQPATVSYTANAKNQYTAVDGSTFTYDAKGNLAVIPPGTAGILTASYAYDSKNRLLEVNSPSTGVNLAMTYDFGPAPLRCAGRRSARKRDTSLRTKRYQNRVVSRTLNGTTRYFIYDQWSLIAEYNSTGGLIQKYVHGVVIDEILVKTQGTTDAFYHHDALGSTVLLTNASSHVVRSYEYDAFGKVQNPPVVDGMFSADPYANRFLFTGREWLHELGLYDYRNRVYSAELGRFLQTDPIRFDAGDVNLYRYVGNQVTISMDAFGLCEGDEQALVFSINLAFVAVGGASLDLNLNLGNLQPSVTVSSLMGGGANLSMSLSNMPINTTPGVITTPLNLVGSATFGSASVGGIANNNTNMGGAVTAQGQAGYGGITAGAQVSQNANGGWSAAPVSSATAGIGAIGAAGPSATVTFPSFR